MSNIKRHIFEWLWWNIGSHLWRKSAQLQRHEEVKRRLGWMSLDCYENTPAFSMTQEYRDMQRKKIEKYGEQ